MPVGTGGILQLTLNNVPHVRVCGVLRPVGVPIGKFDLASFKRTAQACAASITT